ncbi:lysylphosphatidylglycerol synthase transmembrane domain-containing protein [Sporosalibacterium faouarense]|uniref:lysylphosphatidylglycerol synthase transmembrane domain-containing protein n=1 Tax=Sporosalibacterium faouarense TaxID=516123 RepID=UPI00141D0D9B|nr:lysylphosphatidylglycerol synthase transmembrane domain-containing protein [Sporosalibacterium faouarense]MTI48684.1 flippase-like domain-containing protein [Bacillota bacterium]
MKKRLNYILVAFLIALTTWIILTSDDLAELPKLIKTTNKIYISLGLLCMVGFWVCDGAIIFMLKKMINIKRNMMKSFKLSMIGQYFSAITPFATGGQPAQVYSLVKDSVPIGKATSLLINKYIIYQVTVTFYSIIMFIVKLNFVYSKIKIALPFVMTGILINIVGLLFIFGIFFNPVIIKKIIVFLLNFGEKVRVVKDANKYKKRLDHHITEYLTSIKGVTENKMVAVKVVILTIVQLTFRFTVTYFIYLALGFNKASFFDIISIQSLLYMAISFIPTPGGTGAAEGGFFILFKVFFHGGVLLYAVLLWRIISFYFNIVVSGGVTLIDYIMRVKNRIALEK